MAKIPKKAFSAALLVLLFLLLEVFAAGCGKGGGQSADADGAQTDAPAPLFLQSYMTPPPLAFTATERPVPDVRGIYVTSNRAGLDEYLGPLIDLCTSSPANAMVIEAKSETGFVTFEGIPFVDDLGMSNNNISDIKGLLQKLKADGIYTIARLATFNDNNTYNFKPELYIKNQDGTIWTDSGGNHWLNPYDPDACAFVLQIAKSMAALGFDEIQFDYVRFAASSDLANADFGDTGGRTREQAIEDFLTQAVAALHPYGVEVSADVYGTIILSDGDAEIVGQDYTALSRILDVICPMVYPSHFALGSMGIDNPDLAPYDTIYKCMQLSNQRLAQIPAGEHVAVVRPWLQDFTASWLGQYLDYGPTERQEQIQAVYDSGLTQWLLWDPVVHYEADGMISPP